LILRQWLKNPPNWLEIESISLPINNSLKDLDRGESEAISLAENKQADLIILDEQTARAIAKNRGLTVIGILGILYQAALQNLIDLEEVIKHLKTTNFRASNKLLQSLIVRYQQELK
jgi:predicted nucleic acid-binding protein